MKKGRDIFASTLLKLGFPEVLRYFFISFLCKKREGCIKGKKKWTKRKKKQYSVISVVAYIEVCIGFYSSRIQTEFQVSVEVAKYFFAVIVPVMYTSWRQVIRSWNICFAIDILGKFKSEHNLKAVRPSLLICLTLLNSFTMD